MDQRAVVKQRITTLKGLLETPGGPLGPNAGAIGARLQITWDTERRLLGRLLDETVGDDVRHTIARWRDRTRAYADRAERGATAWTDRHGHRWDAVDVLALLDDTEDRIIRWLSAAEAAEPEHAPSPRETASADADDVASRVPERAPRGGAPVDGSTQP